MSFLRVTQCLGVAGRAPICICWDLCAYWERMLDEEGKCDDLSSTVPAIRIAACILPGSSSASCQPQPTQNTPQQIASDRAVRELKTQFFQPCNSILWLTLPRTDTDARHTRLLIPTEAPNAAESPIGMRRTSCRRADRPLPQISSKR